MHPQSRSLPEWNAMKSRVVTYEQVVTYELKILPGTRCKSLYVLERPVKIGQKQSWPEITAGFEGI